MLDKLREEDSSGSAGSPGQVQAKGLVDDDAIDIVETPFFEEDVSRDAWEYESIKERCLAAQPASVKWCARYDRTRTAPGTIGTH